MKKMIVALVLSAVVLTAPAYVHGDVFYQNCPEDCQSCCDACYDWSFWFDPMAVNSCQDDLRFADTGFNDSTESTNDASQLNPDWDFGFRVGLGFRPNCNSWLFRTDYTYWNSETRSSLTIQGVGGGTRVFLSPRLGGNFIELNNAGEEAATSVTLDYRYNLLDVTAGWSCCLCQGLELTPYGGFRGLWFATKVKQITSDSTGNDYSPDGDKSTATNDYSAYGIVGGLRFNYNLCSCLNFYGWFGGSLIAGDNHAKTNQVSASENFRNKETACLFAHSVEGAWGITYGTCMCGKYDTHIGLGYEVTLWNDSMPRSFVQAGHRIDSESGILLQSVVVRLGVGF